MSKPAATVYIVDDDPSFLKGIERLLRSSGYATRCFESASDFLLRRPRNARGCVLTDLRMPGKDGPALQATLAQSDNPLGVVFLTGQGDVPSSVAAMRHGAEDFLAKTAPKEAVIAAVERALARSDRDSEARSREQELQARFATLTPRERQVLSDVVIGRRNKEIAARMGIDERSVKRHRTNLTRKLGVNSVAELVRLVIESGANPGE